MPDAAIYRREGETFAPSEWAGSPWSAELQHGGPVNALFARMAEEAAAEAGLQVARLTVDLFRPVPMEPLACSWRFVRRGRRIANVEVELRRVGAPAFSAGSDPDSTSAPISRASAVLLLRREDLESSIEAEPEAPPVRSDAGPVEFMPRRLREHLPPGFHWSLRVRIGKDEQGAYAWLTSPLTLIEGEETTPLQRCAAISDLTFGLSSRLLAARSSLFTDSPRAPLINTDTTLYWQRPPRGAHFAFRAPRISDDAGIGLAEVSLFDESSRIGSSTQALLANPGAWK